MARTVTKKAAPKTEPDEELEQETDEFEDVEDGDEDLEELDESTEDETDDEKPKAKRKPPVRPTIEFGSPWLAAHVTEVTGEKYDARGIRMLLRKLAKDGVLEREVGVEKSRYEFSGPDDPTVKAVVKMIKSGAAKALKQEGLEKLKAAGKKSAKAKAEPEETEDMEDEVEETPAPKKRRTATKAAAPAKATPVRRRAAK